jgi:succinyl-CoA synthetase beta subunit
VMAYGELKPEIPIVVRLTGTNETQAQKILKEVNLKSADTLDNVVKEAIRLANQDEIGAGRI